MKKHLIGLFPVLLAVLSPGAFAQTEIKFDTLPDGRRLAIAVFITDSTADEATRDSVIAKITRAAYESVAHPHRATADRMKSQRQTG